MATNNQINAGLASFTGTGNFAATTSPTFVTPVIGAATATSISFASTDGIKGVTGASDAATGYVGEYVSSSVLVGSAVSLTSGANANITTLSVGAGDWELYGNVYFSPNGATTSTFLNASVNTVSMSSSNAATGIQYPFTAGTWASLCVVTGNFSVAGATTFYLIARSTFAVNTMSAYGFISARRVR